MTINERLFATAAAIAIFAMTAAAYSPGLSGDYMFDDFPNILLNQRLNIESLSPDQLLSAALSSGSGPLHRPISMVSFALNRYAFGVHPFSFKLTNLIIHMINGVLVLLLSTLLLNAYRRLHKPELNARLIPWTALAVTAAWLLHPLNLTAVLYIVQRMTSLSALFTLAAVCAYVYGRGRASGRSRVLLIWILTPLLAILGLLCKESAALVPLYLLTIEFTVFRFRTPSGGRDRSTIAYFILSVALPALALTALLTIKPTLLLAPYQGRDFTLAQRLLTEPRVIIDYIAWTILPSVRALALYHDDIAVSTGLWAPPTTLASIVTIVGMIATAVMLRRRWPLAALGILWFFAGQMLESTAYPLELAFEHRNYLPDYGILLALLAHPLLGVTSRRAAITGGAITTTFILLLTVVTWSRSYEWRDNVTQAIYEAQHHPESPRAVYAAGRIYANLVLTGATKDSDLAYETLEKASRLDKTSIMPAASLIIFSARQHRPANPEWITTIIERLKTTPISAADVSSLTQLVQCAQKDCVTLAGPIDDMISAALDNAQQRGNNVGHTADLLTIRAQMLTNRFGDFSGARAAMEQACKLAPTEPQYHINLAKLYLVLGNAAGATEQIRQLEALNSLDQLTPLIQPLKRSLLELKASSPRRRSDDAPKTQEMSGVVQSPKTNSLPAAAD